jgi:hypothetical protein
MTILEPDGPNDSATRINATPLSIADSSAMRQSGDIDAISAQAGS